LKSGNFELHDLADREHLKATKLAARLIHIEDCDGQLAARAQAHDRLNIDGRSV
jgi:hypothetical protein